MPRKRKTKNKKTKISKPKKISRVKKEGREIENQVKIIEDIYQNYLKNLNILQKKQDKIINSFIKELEKYKLEEIREKLKTL
jgi:archaellum component FlaC